ncbi:MFS transporter [Azorhizobium oxalatiphilum]|uniref:MFS transporter n=1 Tax=Azorhizobium oxalatiphilum TaxID=980631 RepID=A0A917BNH9_9HYPH|nr:MDR family MFS transporter [Azorhizobium oxalatiphilum]GGF53000.1 MFS transporter [Azorhizobium oxalatiphilum]
MSALPPASAQADASEPSSSEPSSCAPDSPPAPSGAASQKAKTTPRKQPGYRAVALIVASAMFMEQLDATILSTALPAMARDFGVTAPHMSIALTSYLLSLAVFIPASGWAADRFGARTVFATAIAVFTLGSLACAYADSLTYLVVARLLQGMGGAMMIPVGRLVLLRSTTKAELVSAMSWLLVPAMIGPVVGPPLGGFIVTYLDWRWIFYINVPIGILGLILVSRFIANTREERPGKFDGIGLLLSGVSLGSLLFGFELTSRGEGDARVMYGLLLLGLISGALYLRHARVLSASGRLPILDMSLMKIETFRLSVIAGNITRITQGAQPFLLPLMLQLGFGMTAAQSGLITLSTAVGSLLNKGVAPKVLRRFGFRTTLLVNGVICTSIYALCALMRPSWPEWSIYVLLTAAGFFMSMQFTSYNTIAYDEIPAARMSAASSFYTTFQQLMLSMGICVAGVALATSMAAYGRTVAGLADFSVAFVCVTTISMAATFWNARMPHDAGAEISGHRKRRSLAAAVNEATDAPD